MPVCEGVNIPCTYRAVPSSMNTTYQKATRRDSTPDQCGLRESAGDSAGTSHAEDHVLSGLQSTICNAKFLGILFTPELPVAQPELSPVSSQDLVLASASD